MPVFLAIDVGNSSLYAGLFKGETLLSTTRIPTRSPSIEETIARIREFLTPFPPVEYFCPAGVVPGVVEDLVVNGPRLVNGATLDLRPYHDTIFPVRVARVREVGMDRLLNAVAAVPVHGAPLIIVDLGTGTTFDVIDDSGAYIGGVIAPGVVLGATALFEKAALLPEVSLEGRFGVIGRDTVACMQSGILHGQACLVEGLIGRIAAELGHRPKVVATGGAAPLLLPYTSAFDAHEPELVLRGIRLAARRLLGEGVA